MYISHLALASHMYAWTVNKSSPAKMVQRLPRRVISLSLLSLAATASVVYGFGTQDEASLNEACSAHNIAKCWGYAVLVLSPISLMAVGLMYLAASREVARLVSQQQHHPGR